MRKRILFRADGSSSIGLGHIVRSLALVEMLSGDFECTFLTRAPEHNIAKLIASYCSLHELPVYESFEEEAKQLKQLVTKEDILVLDFYQFNEAYQLELKPAVCKMVAIDDNAAIHFYTDIIINHGSGGKEQLYRKENYTKLLTGFPYLLIRKEFREAARRHREITGTRKLFLCMGGADPFNVTNKVLDAAVQCRFIENITVVTGIAYAFPEQLHERIQQYQHKITHAHNVNAQEMVSLISACDIAVCPSSSVSMEVCSVRAGMLTGTVIDNQEGTHAQLLQAGCAITAGDLNNTTVDQLVHHLHRLNNVQLVNELIANQEKMIDGLSGERLLSEFKSLSC